MATTGHRGAYPDTRVRCVADDTEEDREYFVCQCFPLLPAAYSICLLILMEGLFIIFDLCGYLGKSDILNELSEHNPFQNRLHAFLWIISIGDIVLSCVGLFGLWLSFNYMPFLWRKLWSVHSSIAKGSIGSVVVWRLLVTFIIAPWAGVFLAFEPPYYNKVTFILLTMLYIAVSVYSLYLLLLTYNMAALEADELQQRIDSLGLQTPTWREAFSQEIENHIESIPESLRDFNYPTAFCCLPLETTVILYVLALFVGAIIWLVKQIHHNSTAGGWVFMVSVPHMSDTFGLEIAVNILVIIFSLVAISGIVLHRGARDIEDVLTERYQELAEDYSFFEDLAQAIKAKQRSTACLFMYVIFSLLRFATFFPITAMVLVEKDICSLYVHGISDISSGLSFTHSYCSGTDVSVIVLMLLFFCLDAYMLYNTVRLWRYYQSGITAGSYLALPYGSAQGAMKQALL